MNITQIRNATQRITFGGKTFLVDPMLAKKGAYPALPERRAPRSATRPWNCLSISTRCSTLMR